MESHELRVEALKAALETAKRYVLTWDTHPTTVIELANKYLPFLEGETKEKKDA